MNLSPLTMPLPLLLATIAVFTLAGAVKGVVGLGLPTISMALLALLMSPAKAAALLIVPSLATNLWQMLPAATRVPLARRLWPMQAGVCGGTLVGLWLLGAPGEGGAAAALGAVLVLYGGWSLSGASIAVRGRAERWLGPIVGLSTGAVTAATGVFVVPAVPYLQALGLGRDELVQAMGLSFTVSTIVLALGLLGNGSYSGADAAASLWMLLPTLAGMWAGQHLRRNLAPALFRRCFFTSLIVLGLYMVAHEVLKLRL